ncbi:hypothetical protein NDN01_17175 [Sphingomonas sp. QA11]|uniref:hypothetical protein n=1 Tax=Sphingomonas sp. QA11 TaxID=2950605 RepID=UPI00234B3A57|nr:hypothetical protein [Sphingomonas sp. QA11]WCM25759.1 hypothetical protein NDN01_17175 [Sphingomonas sp. QA11]
MPTVPTEQNRVGVAGVTDAKLQPGDYSGAGLQALGAGMRELADTGQKIAVETQQRQDRDDELQVKKAWNAYAEGARSIRTDALGRFEGDPQGMLDSMTRDYGGLRDWIRSGLKNDRQRGQFDHVIAERFDYDLSGALSSAEQAMRRGQNEQGLRIEQNAADDAVDTPDNPALFDKHLQTGVDSIVGRSEARGVDPSEIERSVTAYVSGVRRRVVQGMIDRDPVEAANRYRSMRDTMTPADRQAVDKELLEPLARKFGAAEVDKRLLPEEAGIVLSAERRAAIAQEIEAGPLSETLKRYALDDLDDRASLEARARKQAADVAREAGLATAERLGSGFTSISQIPAAVRRDLDEATDQALRGLALVNLDPTPVVPGGATSLMMSIMASENPAAFAKEDLRLIRGKVAPEEYGRLGAIQLGLGEERPNAVSSLGKISKLLGRPSISQTGFAPLIQQAAFVGGQKAVLPSGRQVVRGLETLPSSEMEIGDINANLLSGGRKRPGPASGEKGMSLNLLSEVKDGPEIAALKKMGSPANAVIIFSHGSPKGQIADASRGERQPALSAKKILARLGKNYKMGTTIILSSCFAANGTEARILSELTGGIVYAARAYVTAPNETHKKYDLTVYSLGYGVGEKSGYVKYYKGKEVPSRLLGLRYDPQSSEWKWNISQEDQKIDVRVPYQAKSDLTKIREGFIF